MLFLAILIDIHTLWFQAQGVEKQLQHPCSDVISAVTN